MDTRYFVRGFKFFIIAALFILLAGGVTMLLWNWLMPALFGLPALSFGQALGLLVLSRLLLGGFGRSGGWGGRRRMWAQRMRERWEKMTPDQRLQWEAQMRERCGPRGNWRQNWKQAEDEPVGGNV
jgi:hypothetical protein